MNKITIIFVCIVFVNIRCKNSFSSTPVAVKGVLDLRTIISQDLHSEKKSWEFERDGNLSLMGEWEFYWNEFINPIKFTSPVGTASSKNIPVDFFKVPSAWNGYEPIQNGLRGKPVSGDGYATYHLKILLNKPRELSMKMPIIVSAYRLYANGKLIAESGVPGKNSKESIPRFFTQVVRLPANISTEVDLVLHISNFHHRKGGFRNPILLGLDKDIHEKRERNLFLYGFPAGAFLIIGFYHFGLYFYRRRDSSALWFGLYSVFMSLNTLLSGEYYFHHIFPNLSYEIGRKVEYITQFMSIPTLVLFIEKLYPVSKQRLFPGFIKGTSYLLALFVLLSPAKIFTYTFPVMEPIMLFAYVYCIYVLSRAFYLKQDGAVAYLFSLIIITGICINDICHYHQIIYTGYYLPIGMVVFIFSQTIFLSRRFTWALIQSEELSIGLEKKVNERTIELEKSNIQISKERDETESLSKLIKNLNENLDIKRIMAKIHEYIKTNYNIQYYGLAVVDKYKERLQTLEAFPPESLSHEDREYIQTFSTNIQEMVFGFHAYSFKTKKPFFVNRIIESAFTPEENTYKKKAKFDSILTIPLILENEPIGFLDLYNVGRMEMTDIDITKLTILGEQLSGIIYSSILFGIINEKTKKLNSSLKLIQHDLSVAKKIQQNMLIIHDSVLDKLKIIPEYIPMSEVGGDFYGIHKVSNHLYRIFLADATGHGVQAALITMAIKGIYDSLKQFDLEPNVILEIFNREYVERYNSLNSYATAIIVDIDTKKRILKFASAGHPNCILFKNSKIHFLSRTGSMIGLGKNNIYECVEYDFWKEDRLYLFTDGIFEEFDSQNNEFGEERVYSIFTKNRNLSIEKSIQELLKNLDGFLKDKPKQDDLTILGIEYQ
ncbi:MAG: SpoIIE family protein phosphatase [Leptospiraceae bacterium]|nr:SpoIIE family protein phosphatase [Leptospiraceae bacterium]MCK6382534.1 SpoIIE family protein phosphatase [Leptospiraceae bacterium]